MTFMELLNNDNNWCYLRIYCVLDAVLIYLYANKIFDFNISWSIYHTQLEGILVEIDKAKEDT